MGKKPACPLHVPLYQSLSTCSTMLTTSPALNVSSPGPTESIMYTTPHQKYKVRHGKSFILKHLTSQIKNNKPVTPIANDFQPAESHFSVFVQFQPTLTAVHFIKWRRHLVWSRVRPEPSSRYRLCHSQLDPSQRTKAQDNISKHAGGMEAKERRSLSISDALTRSLGTAYLWWGHDWGRGKRSDDFDVRLLDSATGFAYLALKCVMVNLL